MADMRELYQEVILDHSKRPRNFRVLPDSSHHANGHNPLCGDQVQVFAQVEDGRIKDLAFQGKGCAISTASSSMMTETLKGKTVDEAEAIFNRFHHLVTEGEPEGPPPGAPELGKLEVFTGVREFPVRVKCATLAWHTLHAALNRAAESVTTE